MTCCEIKYCIYIFKCGISFNTGFRLAFDVFLRAFDTRESAIENSNRIHESSSNRKLIHYFNKYVCLPVCRCMVELVMQKLKKE